MNRAYKICCLVRLLVLYVLLFLHKLPAYSDTIDLDNAIAIAMKYNEQIQMSILEGAQANERVREVSERVSGWGAVRRDIMKRGEMR